MSLPGECGPGDIIMSGANCAESKNVVSYVFYPHQAPVVVSLVLRDVKINRICRTCADKIIDNISYAVGEQF